MTRLMFEISLVASRVEEGRWRDPVRSYGRCTGESCRQIWSKSSRGRRCIDKNWGERTGGVSLTNKSISKMGQGKWEGRGTN